MQKPKYLHRTDICISLQRRFKLQICEVRSALLLTTILLSPAAKSLSTHSFDDPHNTTTLGDQDFFFLFYFNFPTSESNNPPTPPHPGTPMPNSYLQGLPKPILLQDIRGHIVGLAIVYPFLEPFSRDYCFCSPVASTTTGISRSRFVDWSDSTGTIILIIKMSKMRQRGGYQPWFVPPETLTTSVLIFIPCQLQKLC